MRRVLAVPRRPPLDLASRRAEAMVELMTRRLRRPDRPPGSACGCAALGRRRCVDRLLPPQAWALWEAPLAGGLLAPIVVGGGKTLLNVLVAMVMPRCQVAALLVPPKLVEQLLNEYAAIAEHFRVPSLIMPGARAGTLVAGAPRVHVIPYSKFSHEKSTVLLEDLQPDLIIADEIHNLKNRAATRTSRVMRYLEARILAGRETRLCGWSGTITSRSIDDFAHLLAHALGESSPLPIDPREVERWASAIDPSDWPAPMGALRRLAAAGETVVQAVGRRIVETRGVVSTRSASAVGASNVVRERRPPPIPQALAKMIAEVRGTWSRPDGEEYVRPVEVAQCARQLACGFYYRWRFPGDPPRAVIDRWFAARAAWHKELRKRLLDPSPHLDSPKLLMKAAIRFYEGYAGALPTWASATWPEWRDVCRSVKHVTETVWVDDYLVRDAADWGLKNRGIVWYEHVAFGEAVARESGLELHRGGPDAEKRIRAVKGDRSIVASMGSHGEGRDGLQYLFDEQLVANPPSSGAEWEQLLGRLHRVGQESDEVTTHVYRHTAEMADAIDSALNLAKYIEGISTANQRLLAANVEF